MPVVNYCRKCKAETPVGESCPYCGGKLAQTGEQISFGMIRAPKKDWFVWNQYLRVVLPVLLLVFVVVAAAEGAALGVEGIVSLLTGGFWRALIVLLAVIVGFLWLMLHLQSTENVHVVMDKQGIHVRTYVQRGNDIALYARFLNEQAIQKLSEEDERPELEELVLVRKVSLGWNEISRVQIWAEESSVLFYRPSFWQAAAVRVPVEELETVEEYIRKKLKRNKHVRIFPKKQHLRTKS